MPAAVLTHRLDIAEPPTFESDAGRAWVYRAQPAREDEKATLRAWIVEAPWAHPLWHSYLIAVVHLRDLPGVPPAVLRREGMTHEIQVVALDPAHPVDLAGRLHWLTPQNYVGQWRAASDDDAVAKVEGCIRDIVNGRLSPDTDFRPMWRMRFEFDA